MSSSSNSSPSCPGCLDSQQFCHVFPTALPHRQRNILYATVLQQPSLVIDLERQSLYEEDDSIQSLIHVFHHLCSTQIYLGSLKPRTDHIISSTLHIVSALDDTLDLLYDHRFHDHVLTLLPNNITLARVFCPIYHTLTAVEWDAYEESDLRLVNHISSPPPTLPIPAPCAPSPISSLEILVSSPLLTTTTLMDILADPHPAFHQGHTTSYPTCVAPQDPCLSPQLTATVKTVCFHCHDMGHFCVNCPEYECPNCPRPPSVLLHMQLLFFSFCCRFGHLPCYCPDRCCTFCDNPGHIIADCPFSEDPSSGVIFNDSDPKGI